MKKIVTFLIYAILMAAIAGAQSTDQNYIKTTTYLDDSQSKSIESIQYFDGLGRPVQTVQKGITPNKADLVTYQEYDAFGRESNSWLPISVSDNNGEFIPLVTLRNKISGTYGTEAEPYSYPVYEPSPLNRVLEQYEPGAHWHNTGKSVKTDLLTNTDSGEFACRQYSTTDDRSINSISITSGVVPLTTTVKNEDGTTRTVTLTSGGKILTTRSGGGATYYPPGELYVTRMKDEENNVSYEFKDKLGQIILTRQMNDTIAHDTYYVYDSFGNLRAVLPPIAADVVSGENLNENNCTALAQYAYLYKYDSRNRCIWKKLPGCDPVEYKYDRADRLIFSQGGEQALNAEWTFYLYDAFGRIVVQGTCADASRPDISGQVVKARFGGSDNPVEETGYTANVNITVKALDQVNYYDNYNFISGISGFSNKYEYTSECTTPKGLLTGSITYTQGDTLQTLCSAVYYDIRANPVKTIAGNHLGGLDIITTTYTFTGNPETVEHIHTTGENDEGKETLYSSFLYDHGNRLTHASHTLGSAGTVSIVHTYNELGQLEKRTYNGISDLQEEYAYNIRSWLTRLSGKNFKSELEYTDNGNIASMDWGKESLDRKYNYYYDGLSRLDSAIYSKDGIAGAYSTNYKYDKHGNILALQRHGKTDASAYGLIDRLSMGYAGNQLTSLSEMVSGIALPESNDLKVSSTYAYNKNGAMTKDSGKNITDISYNSLNLPKQLTINGNTNHYLYASDGRKLQVKQGDLTRDYVGSFVYENDELKRVFFDGGYWEDKKPYFYFNDHLGNVRAVADEAGEPVQINDYYPFGLPMAETGNDEQDVQPYKFGGKEFDRTDGLNLYDFSARQLDAGLGRFTSIDPMAEKYYSTSPYGYCANNPLKFVDPTGMVMNPIYDEYGNFLGTDDKGLQGPAIIMNAGDFLQGMSQKDAYSVSIGGFVNEESRDKFIKSFDSLPDRPDYDGFVSIEEGVNWALAHPDALSNPTPENSLYINAKYLDFGDTSVADFKGEGIITPINLFGKNNFLASATNSKLRATIYALGRVNLILENAVMKSVRVVNDNATDYDWNTGGGSVRSTFINAERARTGLNDRHGFKAYYYGTGTLNHYSINWKHNKK